MPFCPLQKMRYIALASVSAASVITSAASYFYNTRITQPRTRDVIRASSQTPATFYPTIEEIRDGTNRYRNYHIITSNQDIRTRTVARPDNTPVKYYTFGDTRIIADSFEEAATAYIYPQFTRR